MDDQSELITMISIDDNDTNTVETIENEDTLPYLLKFQGPLVELFTTITCCDQWPNESEVKLYYNCLPKIPMMDKKGKKFIPRTNHQLDLIILSKLTKSSSSPGESQFTGFSLTIEDQPKKFVAHIRKIIRFISKPNMKPLDFSAVTVFLNDIRQFVGWEKYAFFFPIQLV